MSAKSFLISVLLPTPDGPQSTTGWRLLLLLEDILGAWGNAQRATVGYVRNGLLALRRLKEVKRCSMRVRRSGRRDENKNK